MSDLPKTREYEKHSQGMHSHPRSALHEGHLTACDLADAMRDELLARIAELEQYKRESDAALEAVLKDKKQAEAELAERDISLKILQTQKEKHKQARAELADDLDWLIDTLDFNLQEPGFAQQALDKRHVDHRARAEEGSGT